MMIIVVAKKPAKQRTAKKIVDDKLGLTTPRKGVKLRVKAVLTTGRVDDFFKRALGRAAKLDRGEKLAEEIRVTFEDPADLVRALTVERVRVLQAIRAGVDQGKSKVTTPSSLAATLKRDRKSVVRDVNVLEDLGLLETRRQPNPGHGAVKVVEPLAKKYRLTAIV